MPSERNSAACVPAHCLPAGCPHGKEIDGRLLAEPETRARFPILIIQRFPGPRLRSTYLLMMVIKLDT